MAKSKRKPEGKLRKPKPQQYETYSILKHNEGGMGQPFALFLLRDAGLIAERAVSPYVGHTAVRVYGGKRDQNKAARILF